MALRISISVRIEVITGGYVEISPSYNDTTLYGAHTSLSRLSSANCSALSFGTTVEYRIIAAL